MISLAVVFPAGKNQTTMGILCGFFCDSHSSIKTFGYFRVRRQLADWKPGMELPNLPVEDVADEIKRHRRDTSFQIAMKSISILRYLTDHVDELPLGVSTRLAVTHDIPVLLVQLIESKPWIKNDDQVSELVL